MVLNGSPTPPASLTPRRRDRRAPAGSGCRASSRSRSRRPRRSARRGGRGRCRWPGSGPAPARSGASRSASRARRRSASCSRPTTRLYVGRMRLATIRVDGAEHLAAAGADGYRRLGGGADLTALLRRRRPRQPSRGELDRGHARRAAATGQDRRDRAQLPRSLRESGPAPEPPLVFAKFPSSVVGPGAAIVVDAALTERVDWEVELAVVVGARMRHVARARRPRPRLRLHGRQRRLGARRAVRRRPVGARQELRHVLPARARSWSPPTRSPTRRRSRCGRASTAR